MKRKKTRSIASYRAASLKAARVKRQMKLMSREELETEFNKLMHPPRLTYSRALPNPWFDMVRK